MSSAALQDVRPSDLAIAGAVAIAVLVVTTLALEIAHLRRRADAPIIDPGIGVPIRVKPVVDVTPGSAAAGLGEAGLPPEWARAEPPPPPPPEDAVAPVDAPKTPRRRRPTSKDPSPTSPPPTDTPPAEGAATTGEPSPDAEPTGGEGEGGGDSAGDPMAARAIAAYRDRLIRWLSARFQVRGSGLSRADLERMQARVEIEVGETGVVIDYKILSADHPAFEAAAKAAAEAVVGEPVPPPPEFYPGALQRRLRVTFVCTESTCD